MVTWIQLLANYQAHKDEINLVMNLLVLGEHRILTDSEVSLIKNEARDAIRKLLGLAP